MSRLLDTVEDSEKDGIEDIPIEDSDHELEKSDNFVPEGQQQHYTYTRSYK